jgi:hypothetical protein
MEERDGVQGRAEDPKGKHNQLYVFWGTVTIEKYRLCFQLLKLPIT